jgi:hypothetical protein
MFKNTGYGLNDRSSIRGRGQKFSLRLHLQTGSGAHPASYPMGTGGCSWESKAAGARSLPLNPT